MTKKLMGIAAAVALSGAGLAWAAGDKAEKKAEEQRTEQMQMQEHELTGELVRVDANRLYVRHMGAIVPLDLNKDTKFDQIAKRDLKEGDEIRASFTVDKTKNVAKEIKPAQLEQMKEEMKEDVGEMKEDVEQKY